MESKWIVVKNFLYFSDIYLALEDKNIWHAAFEVFSNVARGEESLFIKFWVVHWDWDDLFTVNDNLY